MGSCSLTLSLLSLSWCHEKNDAASLSLTLSLPSHFSFQCCSQNHLIPCCYFSLLTSNSWRYISIGSQCVHERERENESERECVLVYAHTLTPQNSNIKRPIWATVIQTNAPLGDDSIFEWIL